MVDVWQQSTHLNLSHLENGCHYILSVRAQLCVSFSSHQKKRGTKEIKIPPFSKWDEVNTFYRTCQCYPILKHINVNSHEGHSNIILKGVLWLQEKILVYGVFEKSLVTPACDIILEWSLGCKLFHIYIPENLGLYIHLPITF